MQIFIVAIVVLIGVVSYIISVKDSMKKDQNSHKTVKGADGRLERADDWQNAKTQRFDTQTGQPLPTTAVDKIYSEYAKKNANKVGSQSKHSSVINQNLHSNQALSKGHHASHCDIGHNSKDKYRVEKVPVMNSIAGKSTEGCAEHYDTRFVKVDAPEKNTELKLTDLQKAMVYGEVLNNPAFKRNGNYRRFN